MKGNRGPPFDLTRTPPPPVVLAGTREHFGLEPAESYGAARTPPPAAELPPLEPRFDPAAQAAAPPRAWPVYLAAAVVSVLWALGPVLYASAYPRAILALEGNSFALAGFLLVAIGPISLIWISAYLVQQGRGL